MWNVTDRVKFGIYVCNPANPEEFYIKNYDLNIRTRLGALFLVISGTILAITVTVLVLNKSRLLKERKESVQAGLIVGGIVLFLFAGFAAVAGPKNTLCLFGGMGCLPCLSGFMANEWKK